MGSEAVDDFALVVDSDGRTAMRALQTPRIAPDFASSTTSRSRAASALRCLALLLCAQACGLFTLACGSARKVEPPLATPPLDIATMHHAGTALAGALATEPTPPADATAETVLAVHCRFVYLDRVPAGALSSLLETARLVVADSGNQPLITRASRELGIRVGGGEPAIEFVRELDEGRFDRTVVAGEAVEALPEGVTLVVSCKQHAPADQASGRTGERPDATSDSALRSPFSLLLARGSGAQASALTALFALEDPSASAPSDGSPYVERDRRRGVVLTDSPLVDAAPLVVLIPAREGPVPTASLALIVRVWQPRPNGEQAAALTRAIERCTRDIAAGQREAALSSKTLTPEEASANEMVCALQALEIERFHRSALAFLAKSSGAPLAESLALVAEAEPLRKYVTSVIQACGGAQALTRASPALGWKLERAAYLFLADVSVQGVMPPELAALIVRHAGEAGRYPDELEAAVASSRDVASLENQFVAQNRYALQDDRPASRVRAFDWLSARGLAPEGYDPLAPEHARHAALMRAAAALGSAQREAAGAASKNGDAPR